MTMTKMKGMGRQASAARASCNCPFLWPFYHSRRTGEIPSLTAWQPNESSGCVYGSQCGYGRFAGQLDPCGFCGRNVHVACMRRHPLLSGWLDKRDRVAKCFDCALYNGVMFETASPAVYKPYYEQIDWRNRDVNLRLCACCAVLAWTAHALVHIDVTVPALTCIHRALQHSTVRIVLRNEVVLTPPVCKTSHARTSICMTHDVWGH